MTHALTSLVLTALVVASAFFCLAGCMRACGDEVPPYSVDEGRLTREELILRDGGAR